MTNSAGLGFKYNIPRFKIIDNSSELSVGIRKDGGYKGDFWAPSSTIRLNLDLPFQPGIDFSYSTSRRLPDMIDTYWKEDAFATPNPDLLPEKSNGFESGFDLVFENPINLDFRITGFSRNYNDLIIWRKWAGNKFKPVNLSRAKITGWEFDIKSDPFDGRLSLYWKASYLNPLNKEDDLTHHNKYLTYRAVESQNFGINLKLYQFIIGFNNRYIGRRYITEENTKSLPPVNIVNIHIQYILKIKSFEINSKFSGFNLGDKQYEILERQPEKPREFRFTISISKNGEFK
jgi:outer membrane cobalamin receptor